jgi:hypothetical protein
MSSFSRFPFWAALPIALLAGCKSNAFNGDFTGTLEVQSTLVGAGAATSAGPAGSVTVQMTCDGQRMEARMLGCTLSFDHARLDEMSLAAGQTCADPASGVVVGLSGRATTNRNNMLVEVQLNGKPVAPGAAGEVSYAFNGTRAR